MIKSLMLALALTLGISGVAGQSATTVFRGRPSVKISEGGVERAPTQVTRDQAINLECISQMGGSFYWASRENVELTRVESGSFITFSARNGSGYVRVVKSADKGAASLMSPTEERFDYVEHLIIGLRSVTYYGTRQ
ncbi:MAG: hypothetical protein WBD07_10775 [Vicinamibacterales bacterium]